MGGEYRGKSRRGTKQGTFTVRSSVAHARFQQATTMLCSRGASGKAVESAADYLGLAARAGMNTKAFVEGHWTS